MIGGPSLIWLILLIATLSYHRSSVLEIERVKGYPYGTTSKYQAKLQYYSPPKEAKQKTRRVMGS
jgi:hypothetical protein